MKLKWTSKALSDLSRLHEFLGHINGPAAARAVQAAVVAPVRLLGQPRIGEILEEFAPREVRRVLVGHYEMRYEIQDGTLYVVRLWHARGDR